MSDSHSTPRRSPGDQLEDYQTADRDRGRNPEPSERRDVGGEPGSRLVVSSAPTHLPQRAIAEAQVRVPYGFHRQQQQQPSASAEASRQGYAFPQPHSYPPYPGGQAEFVGGQLPGAQSQPAAFASTTPSQPNRHARRTKAHVPSACLNCKRAHLSCDVQRPCPRCVASGKQDSCYDVQHKKRGRPRLRDDRDATTQDAEIAGQQSGTPYSPTSTGESFDPNRRRRTDSLRTLRASESVTAGEATRAQQENNPLIATGPPGIDSLNAPFYLRSEGAAAAVRPVVFLNLDLIILKSNQAFREVLANGREVVGQDLMTMLDLGHANDIQRLKQHLREEKEDKDPTYMPPINSGGQNEQEAQQQAVQHVTDLNFESYCQDYDLRHQYLRFRLPDGQLAALDVLFHLARTSLFFVTLALPPIERRNLPVFEPPIPSRPRPLPPTPTASGSASAGEPTRFFSSRPAWAGAVSSPPLFSRDAPAAPVLPTAPPATSFMTTGNRGSEQDYPRSYQSSPVGFTPPTPYGGASRPSSVASGGRSRAPSLRDPSRPDSRGLYQFSPSVGPSAGPAQPSGVDTGDQGIERARQREPIPSEEEEEREGGASEGNKKRRFGIDGMLD